MNLEKEGNILNRLNDYGLSKEEINYIDKHCPVEQIIDTLRQLDERKKVQIIPVPRHFILDTLKVRTTK